MPPFPAAQCLRGLFKLHGGLGHMVPAGNGRGRGSQPARYNWNTASRFSPFACRSLALARSRCSFASIHFQATPANPPKSEVVKRPSKSRPLADAGTREPTAPPPNPPAAPRLAFPRRKHPGLRPERAPRVSTVRLLLQAVQRDRFQVARQARQRSARDHAEVIAAREAQQHAGERVRGGTAYVTLEPCNHTGRTAPCTLTLISAGLKRVVAATIDPNPRVAGHGLEALRAAGLQRRLEFVRAKLGVSITALPSGRKPDAPLC